MIVTGSRSTCSSPRRAFRLDRNPTMARYSRMAYAGPGATNHASGLNLAVQNSTTQSYWSARIITCIVDTERAASTPA